MVFSDEVQEAETFEMGLADVQPVEILKKKDLKSRFGPAKADMSSANRSKYQQAVDQVDGVLPDIL